ncbi:sodium/hydrogen exchanger 9B1-like [Trichoplusia ni]|uniref:Sodium/hydrogen exchanger 9B1-like n=1 Tax=Trichoplusia ni TaxID=7111 RepID=A0A7E5WD59_TRINI|nr:sodium/hydrogen exchanger 9B1-like [Trichoplusia ni]
MTANNCDVDKNENIRTTNVTTLDLGSAKTTLPDKNEKKIFLGKLLLTLPTVSELRQYVGVFLCGLTLWGSSWFIFKDAVTPDGYLFNMCGVVIAGYIFGHTLERYTTINPVVGMTLTGALYRNFGPPNFLEHPVADVLDYHLRRVYPVIILTKGPLTWNWEYIKHNSVKVFSLATLPWIVECLSTAFFAHILLEFPWYWGLHLGSILASVSPAVVVPTVTGFDARGLGTKNQIALLVANSGGLDTAFTEGMCGVINSAIFYPATLVYRIIKGLLAIFVGIALGILWGVLSDSLPDHSDIYAPTIRSLLIFAGGLLLTYAGGYLGWGGTSGVAIMVCAGTAATRWARRDWPLADNPVWEVYKLLWRIFEPMLFTLSGYFLNISQLSVKELCLILGCISAALVLRLLTAFLVALANELSIKESLFVAVTWIPKAIVETVLVRVAMDSLWEDASATDKRIAAQHANIIVIAVLITSTLGSVLTTVLGPVLLSQDSRVAPEDFYRTQTLSPPQSSNLVRRTNTPNNLQCIDG